MTFTVEDGTGLAAANSYGAEADADAYFADRNNAAWAALASADKQYALVKATDYLDQLYASKYRGTRLTSTQGLEWPRDDAYDDLGEPLGADSVPTKLKYACYEAALRAASATLMPDPTYDVDAPGPIKSKVEKVGPLEEATQYAVATGGSSTRLPVYPVVERWVRFVLKRTLKGSVRY